MLEKVVLAWYAWPSVHACALKCVVHAMGRALITETLIPEQVDEEPDDDIPDNSTFGDHIRSEFVHPSPFSGH